MVASEAYKNYGAVAIGLFWLTTALIITSSKENGLSLLVNMRPVLRKQPYFW